MNHPSSRRTSSRSSLRRSHIALSFALVCGLFASATPAQVIISDPLGIIKQAAQLEQEVQSAANTYATLQSILTTAQSLGSNISLVSTPLKKITNSGPIIDSACPGASGSGIAGEALSAIASALNANQSIASRQQVICSTIVVYQIDEYNKTVDALNAVGQYSATTLSKLNDLANLADTLGKTSTAQAQAANMSVALSAAMNTWQTQISSDQAMVSALQTQQSILAKVAMNGNPTILGTVIQASALKVAFTLNQ
jgi:hypothetical protein